MKRITFSFLFVVFSATLALAYGFDISPKVSKHGLVKISGRFVSAALDENTPLSFSPSYLVSYGFLPNADIRFYGALTSMKLRYDFSGDNLAVGTLQISATHIRPGFDFFYYSDYYAIELNSRLILPFDDPGANLGVSAVLAPSVKYGMFAAYLEAIPTYSLTDGGTFTLDIVPGIYINVQSKIVFFFAIPLKNIIEDERTTHIAFNVVVPFMVPLAEKKEQAMPVPDSTLDANE